MSDMIPRQMPMPQIHVRVPGRTPIQDSITEIVYDRETIEMVMALGDPEILRRAFARFFDGDAPTGQFMVSRPSNGNILIAPKATFG